MTTYILILVIAYSGMTTTTQEFSSRTTCEAAKAEIREKLTDGKISLAICTPK